MSLSDLLSSVLDPGNGVDWRLLPFALLIFGIVLFGFWYKDRKGRHNLRRYGLADIDRMSGEEFEDYLALLYKSQGWSVEQIGGSGDFGADLIIKKKNKSYVVQAKRYSEKVSLPAIQQSFTAMYYYRTTGCLVVTNSFFTRNAQKLADAVGCELIDRNNLAEYIEDLKKGKV